MNVERLTTTEYVGLDTAEAETIRDVVKMDNGILLRLIVAAWGMGKEGTPIRSVTTWVDTESGDRVFRIDT